MGEWIPEVREEAQPFFFGAAGRELFGWYYPACGQVMYDCGIVLCPPLGHEYMWSHRAFLRLAEELALAGFPVLRFDYHGTGNSWGNPRDAGQLRGWRDSIRVAVAKIRELSGAAAVSLVGLRLGATLAMVDAGEHDDLASIVLWAPYSSGRAYLRELHMLQVMADYPAAGEAVDHGTAGFLLTPDSATDIRTLNLMRVRPRVPRVLVIARDDRPTDQALLDHLRGCGTEVVELDLPGTAAMLVDPITSAVPTEVIGGIARWLSDVHASGVHAPAAQSSAGSPSVEWHSLTRSVPALPDSRGEEPEPAIVHETAVRFGKGRKLFGIVTAPKVALDGATRPAVIFLNTAAYHNVGPNRMYVPLARDLATHGFFTFRFDLAGLGESVARGEGDCCVTYPGEAVTDIREAIALLRETCGVRQVALVGLCSGGYFAIRGALSELPVVMCISISPPLYWTKGRLIDTVELQRHVEVGPPKIAFWTLRKRLNLLSTSPGLGRALVGSAMGAMIVARTALHATGLPTFQRAVGAELRSLSDRGTDTLLIFARGDRVLVRFEMQLGRRMRALRGRKNIRVEVVDGANHAFQPIQAQQRLHHLIVTHIVERFG